MALDLVPKNFWSFPASRFFDWDEDELIQSSPSGLSVSEDNKNVYIEAALPGIKPEDVEITFDKGMLWIKGESKQEEIDKDKKYFRKATNSFSYRVAVPGEIDMNKEPIAESENGVMKISFAKHPQVQPKKISVKVKK